MTVRLKPDPTCSRRSNCGRVRLQADRVTFPPFQRIFYNRRMAPIHDVYERYAADVYRFALYLSGEPADAEDITADTFVRLWTAPGEIRTATVKAYLFTIARRLYLDRQRARKRFTELDDSMLGYILLGRRVRVG